MNRRDAVLALIALSAAPLTVKAQQPQKIPRIGVLWHAGSEAEEARFLTEFRRGLRDLGYEEGRNITLENRFPAEQPERFNSFAVELARLNVDVLVAVTRPAAMAAQRATTSIPVVFLLIPDAVESKLVKSLGRPGGNITGLSNAGTDIGAKRLQLLKQAVPTLSRVAAIINPNNPGSYSGVEAMLTAAAKIKVTVRTVEARAPDEFVSAFSTIIQDRADGVIVGADGMLYIQRARIAALALERRLPTMFIWREGVESGGLMSYGPNLLAMFYRTGYYVDKIIKGAKPEDLPVEEPTKFDMFINGKTAKALGLTIPQSLLLFADEVIE